MTPKELFEGYMWVYPWRSILKKDERVTGLLDT